MLSAPLYLIKGLSIQVAACHGYQRFKFCSKSYSHKLIKDNFKPKNDGKQLLLLSGAECGNSAFRRRWKEEEGEKILFVWIYLSWINKI